MEEINKTTSNKLPNQEIDYFKLVKIIISRWYWIAASVVICLIFANLYLWYTPKIYATSATMKLEDKKSELPDITGAITGNDRNAISRVQSETIVLQSTALLLNAIRHLDYRMSFYIKGRVLNRTAEMYPEKPLDISLVKFDSLNFYNQLVTFKPVNAKNFILNYKLDGKDVQKMFTYDLPFLLGPTGFNIKAPNNISKYTSYQFKLNSPLDFIGRVRGGMRIGETSKNSNILSLQETDSNAQFASDALNAVMQEYLSYDRIQKMQSATQMIDFINSQLGYLGKQLDTSEKLIEGFKKNLKIIDVSAAATTAMTKANELQAQQSVLKIQLLALDQLKEDIIKEKDNVTLNFSTEGVANQQLQIAIAKLDNLISSKNALAKTYIAKAQQITDINQQILQIKSSAIDDINISRSVIEKSINFINGQLEPINQQISHYPAAENDIAGLQRNHDVNQKVYDLLSEKKLNAQISRAGVLAGASIIDLSQPNFNPVSPDDNNIKHSALIFGLGIGLGMIVLIRILNPYIYDKETIESLTAIPIIGVIRKFPEEIDEFSTQILAVTKPKSIFAESVRSVRTNLSFLSSEKKSKVICITSEVAGEGKSFVAVNLASTLSLIDKKVIIIAADLRRSKMHKTFNVNNDMGLSNFLANQCELNDIIMKSDQAGLEFILSGPVPPNPSELLHSERMIKLIDSLKQNYDIIMIDTAPIGLVSDAIPLIRMSDINLFVIRSGKSKLYAATVPQRIAQEYSLDNTVIVLNAFDLDLLHSRYYNTKLTSDTYNGKYYYYSDYTGYESSGYYVDQKKKNWWDIRRWF